MEEKAVAKRCSVKKVFLEISQNLQENTCARVLCFPVNFVKFLRTTFFYRTSLVAASGEEHQVALLCMRKV